MKLPDTNLWMDSYLAAFAIACGAQLVTTDKAFSQFPGLDVLVIPPKEQQSHAHHPWRGDVRVFEEAAEVIVRAQLQCTLRS